MSKREKQKYIRKYFYKQCRVLLEDVMKKRRIRRRRRGGLQLLEVKDDAGPRKKYSCYICFEKFITKEELDVHKDVHNNDEDEKSRDSAVAEEQPQSYQDEYSQDGFEDVDVTSLLDEKQKSRRKQSLSTEVNIDTNSDYPEYLAQKTEPEEVPKEEVDVQETPYKCSSCNVYFLNQVDIKNHFHNQYWCKYFCKKCGRQFNTKGGFIVHVLQHGMKQAPKYSYKCDKCPFSFDDCFQLKRHCVTSHNIFTDTSINHGLSITAPKDSEALDNRAPKGLEPLANTAQVTVTKSINEPRPSVSTTHTLPVNDPPPKLNMDPSNPITGTIPIFDCDVCYDVFASQKALRRHKTLHEEQQAKEGSTDLPICIDDDDVQVIQQDAWHTPHEVVASFRATTRTPRTNYSNLIADHMAKITPIRTNQSPNTDVAKSSPDVQPESSNEATLVDKSELTAQITQMLGGHMPASAASMVLNRHPPASILAKPQTKTSGKSQNSTLVRPQTSLLRAPGVHTLINTPNVSKALEVPVSVVTTSVTSENQNMQLVRVVNSDIGNQQTSSITAKGQSYFMMNKNKSPIIFPSLGTGLPKTSTISSEPSISQPIPGTGGVAVNPSTSSAVGTKPLLNPNLTSTSQTAILNSLGGLSGLDPNSYIYVLVPTSDLKKNEAQPPLPALAPRNSIKKEKHIPKKKTVKVIVTPSNIDAKSQTSALKNISSTAEGKILMQRLRENYKTLNRPSESVFGNSFKNDDGISNVTNENTETSVLSDPVVMPIITNVRTSEDIFEIPEDSENDTSSQDASQGDDCEFVMPIITSIGTVSDDISNKSENTRKDPVSMYENEFARFLATKSDDHFLKSRDMTQVKTYFKKTLEKTQHGRSSTDSIALDQSSSNKDLIINEDAEPLSPLSASESAAGSSGEAEQSSTANVSQSDSMPKIFVKKLTDLQDVSKKSTTVYSEISPQEDTNLFGNILETCNFCNESFRHWANFKMHMQETHGMFACKFFKCRILKDKEEHKEHMRVVHTCTDCGGEFRSLVTHKRFCSSSDIQRELDLIIETSLNR